MSAKEKSDLPEVAEKRANKAASAATELVETASSAATAVLEAAACRPRAASRPLGRPTMTLEDGASSEMSSGGALWFYVLNFWSAF